MTKTPAERKEDLMRKNNEGNNNSQKQNIETDGQELGSKNEIQTSSIQRVKNRKYS